MSSLWCARKEVNHRTTLVQCALRRSLGDMSFKTISTAQPTTLFCTAQRAVLQWNCSFMHNKVWLDGTRESSLKVLTNEKRGGLKVLTFDRSPFKLFSLRFSAKSVQTPSCERLKTTQRILFQLFSIKNCFPIAVLRRRFMKKSGKLNCHVVN
jgi:hypothetical protein